MEIVEAGLLGFSCCGLFLVSVAGDSYDLVSKISLFLAGCYAAWCISCIKVLVMT